VQVGCLAGGAVVQTVGSEMGPSQWQWLHSRLHGELAGAVVRDSAAAVQQEMLACYALIEKKGRGGGRRGIVVWRGAVWREHACLLQQVTSHAQAWVDASLCVDVSPCMGCHCTIPQG
jgi:hypothetical protein